MANYVHILSCVYCGHSWRWLQHNGEPLPPCPNPKCSNKVPTQELAAPGVARGAAPQTSWAVPETRAGREKFAWEMAQGMGFTDMKSSLKEGETQAPSVPDAVVTAPNGRTMKVQPNFAPAGVTPDQITSTIANITAGGGGPNVNRAALRVLGGMKGR